MASTVTEIDEVTGATMLQESFAYDAAGNRREVKATSNGATQDAWYTYDGDNRVEVADGALQNGQIVVTGSTGSYENAYDANGNVIKIFTRNTSGDLMAQTQRYDVRNQLTETDYAVDVTTGAANQGVQELATYDANGHALVSQTYYAQGATIQSNNQTITVSGELESATVNFYDAVGRLAESQTFSTPSGWDGTASPIPTGTPSPDATTYGSLTLQSAVVYQGPNGSSGYDADGDVVAYQYRDNTGRVDQYQVNYLKKDGYLQGATTGDSNTSNVYPATDQSIYNTRGNEIALEQHSEDPYGTIADTVHVFAYNGTGEIIEREDGTGSSGASLNLGSSPDKEVQHYAYVDGQQLAHFDNAGTLDVLDQVTAFSSNNDSPNSYVVQTGDTLESIAQAKYGNANLWYVIAQANDLSSDTNLALGQRLQIPAVTTHANSATTFKPYDPSSIIGSTTPNLPMITLPPPPVNHCSWLAQLVSVVVTAVVTFFSDNPVAGAAAGNASEQVSQAMLNGTYDWGRFLRHTMDPFEGSHAGLAKTILGQIVPSYGGAEFWTSKSGGSDLDIAIWNPPEAGMKGQFDRQSTLIAAGVGAVTWGAGSYVSDVGGSALEVAGASAAAGYVANAGLNAAFGRPADFSVGGLAVNVLAAVAGAEAQSYVPVSGPVTAGLAQATGYAVRDVVDRELSLAMGDQNVPSWAEIGVDAFGNGLASGAELGVRNYQEQQGPLPSIPKADYAFNPDVSIQPGPLSDISPPSLTDLAPTIPNVSQFGPQDSASHSNANSGNAIVIANTYPISSLNGYINDLNSVHNWAIPLASPSLSATDAYQNVADLYYAELNFESRNVPSYRTQPPSTTDNVATVAQLFPAWNGPGAVPDGVGVAPPDSSNGAQSSVQPNSSAGTTVQTNGMTGYPSAQNQPAVNNASSIDPSAQANSRSIPSISIAPNQVSEQIDSPALSIQKLSVSDQLANISVQQVVPQVTSNDNLSSNLGAADTSAWNFGSGSATAPLKQQLKDVVPGSGAENKILQSIVIAGSTSRNPGDMVDVEQAAQTLKMRQIAGEITAFGRPLPTVNASPDMSAQNAALLQMKAAEDGPGAMITLGYAKRAGASIQQQYTAEQYGAQLQDAIAAHYALSNTVSTLRSGDGVSLRVQGAVSSTEGESAAGGGPANSLGPIFVTPKGVAVTSELLSLQGTSPLVGHFRGLTGATVEEIVSRVPSDWSLVPQDRGVGIKFLDDHGFEQIRIHGPSLAAPVGSNSASGWTLRVMDQRGNYYNDLGIIVPYKANDGHIPIYGNSALDQP